MAAPICQIRMVFRSVSSFINPIRDAFGFWRLFRAFNYQLRSRYCSAGRDTHGYLSEKEYWDRSYQSKSQREWLLDYSALQETIHSCIPTNPFIFMDLGCGISDFSFQFLSHLKIQAMGINVDFSLPALEYQQDLMKQLFIHKPQSNLHTVQADGQYLPFFNKTFDLIFDKGTTDSVLKNRETGMVKTKRTLQECMRVLDTGGLLIQVTDEDPDMRLPLLHSCLGRDKVINFKTIETPIQEYFVYMIRR